MKKFHDRDEAGKILAKELSKYMDTDAIVLALPRGGVPVAYQIAKALNLLLDVFIVRKVGVPGHAELAMGAIARGSEPIFNKEIINSLSLSKDVIEDVVKKEKLEIERRYKEYRENKSTPNFKDKTIILVDDGIATGATFKAAVLSLRQANPKKIVMAVPVSEANSCEKLSHLVDEVVCPKQPKIFYAVGEWYDSFPQTEDAEVKYLMSKIS